MATYKGINGFAVQSVASDPSPLDEGQVWYNNATYAFKLASVTTAGTWASGGALNTPRNAGGGAGIQTAALLFGGAPPTPGFSSASESYNGTAWTTTPSINFARRNIGSANAGTQTAALGFGGAGDPPSVTSQTESWNGSSWTISPATLNTARSANAGAGIQTAALSFGGFGGPTSTESYNGTSWTSVSSMNTGRDGGAGCGIQTAALSIRGGTAAVESWNGTSWTAITSTPISKDQSGAAGTQTAALVFGGYPNTSDTILWNGTSWTSNPNGLATARGGAAGAGTQTLAIAMGGSPGGATEEWTGPGSPVTRTITTS